MKNSSWLLNVVSKLSNFHDLKIYNFKNYNNLYIFKSLIEHKINVLIIVLNGNKKILQKMIPVFLLLYIFGHF